MRPGHVKMLAGIALAFQLLVPAGAQEARKGDWRLNSLDLGNTRFSPLDQINGSNVGRLAPAWSLALTKPDSIGQETPLVVDGVMYFNDSAKLFAIDAATGKIKWVAEADLPEVLTKPTGDLGGTGGRGPAYGDGRIYATAGALLYAVDVKAGKVDEKFGNKGWVSFVADALRFKYPGEYPEDDFDPRTLFGHRLTAPPTYHNGTVYVATAGSSNLINGGLLIALDAATGATKWVFTTIPQGPDDSGWEAAKDTWGGGFRWGGGIWAQPAIDPDLGMIYLNATNPTPDYYATQRPGMNLFTNSMLALHLETGELAWYFQTNHHDLWDYDLASGPVLFDHTVNGKVTRGIASFGKTCWAYILNRENGQPINPIVESPVPTTTDVPGEQPWPTQPIPYSADGTPQQPFCRIYPIFDDPEVAKLVRPQFHPPLMNETVITAPGAGGGATWTQQSFSPRTNWLYIMGKNTLSAVRSKLVRSETLKPAPTQPAFWQSFERQQIPMRGQESSSFLSAYDPVTGEQMWRVALPSSTQTGNLVTAGDVVFQALGGNFYAFDARTGRELFKTTTPEGSRVFSGSPMTYQVDGKQYVSIAAGTNLVAFSLPATPNP